MKISILIFGLVSVSNGQQLRSGELQPIYLREESEVTNTTIISAELGEFQDFHCPRDQVFRLYKVSEKAYRKCNLSRVEILKCNMPERFPATNEIKVRFN